MPTLKLTDDELNTLQFNILPIYMERMRYDATTMRNSNQTRLAEQFDKQLADAEVMMQKIETCIIND